MRADAAVPAIHAVTTDEIIHRADFVRRARSVMAALGPRGAVELRAPQTGAWALAGIARTLAPAQESTGAWIIVTERIDVALATGARAVQLTRRSMAVADARRVAPELPIGASIHTLEEGIGAAAAGARWGVVARATAFSTKLDGRPHPALFPQLVARCALPLLVIGGVLPTDVGALRAAGAHGVAAIRGIWDADNAEHAAIEYLSAYETHPGPV